MNIASYESDLTDAQWDFLQPMLPEPKKLGRPPTDRRRVINAILYVLKGGVPWRLLPQSFPPCKTVYHIFRKWSRDHTWAALNDALRVCLRAAQGRDKQPSAAILDSQSVKSDGHGGEAFAQWVREHWPKLQVEVVKRSDSVQGFAVLPRRWVVERTFGWLMRHRRLVRDYERTEASAESWIYLAMIRLQLRRLA